MKQKILELKQKGLSHNEVVKILGCAKSTVAYYCNDSYRLERNKAGRIAAVQRKINAVEYKGGKCEICGYDECYKALHFHHTDPTKKDPNFVKMMDSKSANIEKIKPELDKCLLVCANCHIEIHAKWDEEILRATYSDWPY